MRYVPDPFKNEFVNIGVVLLARDLEFTGVRFTRDWGRVRCVDPQADIDILEALEADIGEQLRGGAESRNQVVHRLQDTLSTGLQISEPKAILSASPQRDLDELARTYLERILPKREGRIGARQYIVAQMQEAFESAGVWGLLNKKIKASQYTRPGDPLKIDCGYRRNGVIRLFQAVSLTTEPDTAKILAFSYPILAEGIERIESAKTDFTAIVENDLDRSDEAVQFAVEALQRTSIHVAGLSQMPELAERARAELRL